MLILAPILPCPWGTPSRRHIRRDPPSSFCWHHATLHFRNGRSRCSRPLHRTATLAAVGALLSSFSAGFLSADAAQTRPRGSTGGTSAAFSNLEKLRLTLALARSYRLTE